MILTSSNVVELSKLNNIEENTHEISDRVLLKAMLVWIKIRFAVPLKLTYPNHEISTVNLINDISNNKRVAAVSDEDVWTMQRNAFLFNQVARVFTEKFMTPSPDLFSAYGSIIFQVDYKRRDAAILMNAADYKATGKELYPCIMYVKPKAEMLKEYKEHGIFHKQQIDIVPLLKSKCDVFLTDDENALIDNAYDTLKSEDKIIKNREEIELERHIEVLHMNAVVKAINRNGDNTSTTQLAISLHTIVEMSYTNESHNVLKIKPNGGDNPVMDYTRAFIIKYDVDLCYIANILRPSINPDIKIVYNGDCIIFSTRSGVNPDDDAAVAFTNPLIIKSEEQLSNYFNNVVAPLTKIEDVERIMQRILQDKYKDYY